MLPGPIAAKVNREVRTYLVAFGGAALLHVALFAVARVLPPPDYSKNAGSRALESIEIEIQPTPPAPPPPKAEVPAAVVDPGPVPAPNATEEPSKKLEAQPVAVREGSVPPGPTAPPTGPVEPPPAPTGSVANPSKGGFDELPPDDGRPGNRFTLPPGLAGSAGGPGMFDPTANRAGPAPTVAPSARPVDVNIAGKVIADAMGKRDKDLGIEFPGGGTVASAVRGVVQGSDVPNESKASIEFRIGPGGQVLGVRVVGYSGGSADSWARVASAAAAAMAGRMINMTAAYAKGAIVTIDVSSTLAPPSGKGSGLSGTGLKFDMSNLGAHATRVVRASPRVAAVR